MVALSLSMLTFFFTYVSAVTFYNGAQKVVLAQAMSSSCDVAWNTAINCPENLVQWTTYNLQAAAWNTSTTQQLCTSTCQSSLANLKTAVQNGCGAEKFNLGSQNMTFVQLVDFVQYKYGLICLTDDNTGQFCSDVEDSWNITALVASNQATWPQNTTKCYPDINDYSWDNVLDEFGNCYNPADTNIWLNVSDIPVTDSMSAMDYYQEMPDAVDDDNYGWSVPLESDEYPLEIQCSSCFLKRFKYGLQSVWGDAWDEITDQIWANMQLNCGSTDTIVPANDISGNLDPNKLLDADTPTVADLSLCSQIITSAENQTCADIVSQHQIPSAALFNLNDDLICFNLGVRDICAPRSCPITIYQGRTTSIYPFMQQYSNFTMSQFLAWNQFIDTRVISRGDAVCVGPPGGVYVPPTAAVPSPSVYTTTDTPAAPTQPGTIPNCGHYYTIALGDTCNMIALNFSITFSDLIDMNPTLDSACSNLIAGYDYCVAPVNGTTVPHVTSTRAPSGITSSATPSNTPTSSSSTSTPSYPPPPGPTVAGTTPQCNTWYTVRSSDTCAPILSTYGITLSQFRAWNTFIDSSCSNLWLDYSYCVSSTLSAPSPTTSSAPPAVTPTPTPTQAGMVSGCTTFHQAVSGEYCALIAGNAGVSTQQFIDWNPAVGSDCASLWLGYWYCVSV